MSISEDNTRVLITIPKTQKEQLNKLAQKDNRTLSNLCAKILSEYLEKVKEGEQADEV